MVEMGDLESADEDIDLFVKVGEEGRMFNYED
eukprot:CAMPEP_0170479828 /NCGR_PEP_ID=MMETSP0208-20121228/907_1 /TAXON_ID=197538 /ORGANISM="Strombidium inclinatum, Strain S3" /LENGTH=31 /DNA_ID= /DNA_START= /DNA_END= /DNA_ORIENTATION=